MLCVVVLAKGLGASLPILFKSIGLDPALMSGPFITSVLDVFGLFVYLNLARLILIPVLAT
jgi:magnesium transporter